ncbi:MAG: DUF262 domain-containing HNH endonuclease family protein [Luteolibacter sp.]
MSLQNTHCYTIRNLFEEPVRFDIPSYQRAYSWDVNAGKQQVRQFIADLEEQHPDKGYYLGHFLFEQGKESKLHVIDGQQRLTTVVIFFAAVVQEMEGRLINGDTEAHSIELSRLRETYFIRDGRRRFDTVAGDRGFFRARILDRTSREPGDTSSRRRIAEADEWFSKAIKDKPTHELRRWVDLVEAAAITTFPVTDKIQATQIFAFQNDRGKDLTQLEKLKAYLMYQVYLHSDTDREIDEIGELEAAFGEIYTTTPRLDLNEDQVLSHHCTTYLRPSGGSMETIKAKLGECKSSSEKVKWIVRFVAELRDTYTHVERIEEMARHHERIADPLILDAGHSWPLLLKLYRDHREAIAGPSFDRLLRLVEMATFKKIFLHGSCVNDLPNWAFHLQAGGEDALEAKLEQASRRSFRGGQNCGAALRDAFTWTSHWSAHFRYLLWKYENSLRKDRDYLISPGVYMNELDDPRMGSTLDHIIPRNPKEHIHEDEFIHKYLNDLGNLVLMTHSANSSYGRMMPSEKWQHMMGSSLASHREIGESIRDAGGIWDKKQIEDRKNLIAEFAFQHWEAIEEPVTIEQTADAP